MRVSAYHIYQTPGPRLSGWQCDVADGNDQTIAEGYGKTPEKALKKAIASAVVKGAVFSDGNSR